MPVMALLMLALSAAPAHGVAIQPGEDGAFSYSDDFKTPRFLRVALLDGLTACDVAVGNSVATMKLDTIESRRIFLLKRRR